MSLPGSESIRAFLLGELSDAEVERLEAELAGSEALRAAVRAVAAELIDAYVEGTLSEAQACRLEARYLPDSRGRRRVEFARLLVARARPDRASWSKVPWVDPPGGGGAPRGASEGEGGRCEADRGEPRLGDRDADRALPARPRRSPLPWTGGALAAMATATVVALGGARSTPAVAPEVVRASLAPALTRSAGADARALAVPTTEGRLEVELALDDAQAGRVWSVRLVRGGRTVWAGEPRASDAFGVTVSVPLDRIRPGRHVFELRKGRGPAARFAAEYPWVATFSSGSSRSL